MRACGITLDDLLRISRLEDLLTRLRTRDATSARRTIDPRRPELPFVCDGDTHHAPGTMQIFVLLQERFSETIKSNAWGCTCCGYIELDAARHATLPSTEQLEDERPKVAGAQQCPNQACRRSESRGRNTMYCGEVQLRSADEGFTVRLRCNDCGMSWTTKG